MSARAPVLAVALAILLFSGGSAGARGTGAKKGPSRTASAKGSAGKKAASFSASSKRLAKTERGRGKRHDKRRRYYAPPQMPQTLELLDLDLVTGFAHVVAVGTTRVPDARLFVLTDDRGRRFVPEQAECAAPPGVSVPPAALQPDEPGTDEGGGEAPSEGAPRASSASAPVHEATASGGLAPINTRWRCTLTVSRLYRRARLVAVSMEWGQKAVDVPAKMVAAVWKKAAAAAPDVAVAETAPAREAVRPPPSPLPPEDAPEEEGPAESTRDVGATVE